MHIIQPIEPDNPTIAELKSLEISEMTPVQAMIKLEQLQKLAKS